MGLRELLRVSVAGGAPQLSGNFLHWVLPRKN